MTKALCLAYYFPPMGGAGVQRIQKFVQYLPMEGFLPEVVAGPTSFAGHWTPGDNTLLKEIPADIEVHRQSGPAPALPSKWARRRQLLLGQTTPFWRSWVNYATKTTVEAGKGARFIFVTMSPFESATAGDAASRRLGVPWVADLRDPWALDEIQVYPTWLHHKLEMQRMGRLLSRAAVIVMNTPEAANELRRAFPNLSGKTIVTITNGFDRADFDSPVAQRRDGKFRIVHAGSLHTEAGRQGREETLRRLLGGRRADVDLLTRSPAILIEALSRWCQIRPEVQADLEVVFAGEATKQDLATVASPVIAKAVRFPGYLSHAASLELVRTADLLFLPLHNLKSGKRATIVPGKTYEYMASGRPILAAVPEGDAMDFLSQCGTGLICRPDDVVQMIRILDRVYSGWKTGTKITDFNASFVSQFERKTLTQRLSAVFRSLLADATKPQ